MANNLFPYPVSLNQSDKELTRTFGNSIDEFFKTKNSAPDNDLKKDIPESVREGMRELGVYGLLVPEKYGGTGLNNVQYASFCEITGYYDLAIGVFLAAHQSIGYKGVLIYGTKEQKLKYLPKLASGEWVASYCLTEPGSGSDVQSLQTKAVEEKDGSFTLEGTKIWISNGAYANFFTVFARLVSQDQNNNGKICCFLVEKSFGNIEIGKRENKMGINGSATVSVTFNGTKVPKENLLGAKGKGFHIAVHILNNGRHGLAAATCGAIKRALDEAINHSKQRKQFGTYISEFGAIQEKLSYMAAVHYANQSMAYHIAALIDANNACKDQEKLIDFSNESALAKIYGSESAWGAVDEAIQVLGGMGYMKECELERILRDLRIFRIFEGTNDILRLMVARNGLKTLGADLKSSLKSPLTAFKLMFDATAEAGDRSNEIIQKSIEAVLHPELKHHAEPLARTIEKFKKVSTKLLMKYQKDIQKHQYIVYRFGTMSIYYYAIIASLARCTKSFENNVDIREKNLVQRIVDANLVKIDDCLRLLENDAQSLHKITEISNSLVIDTYAAPTPLD